MNRVLVFTSTFPRFTEGDATPPFVYELSRRLVSDNTQIIILTPRVPGSKRYEERDGMKIYRYSYFFHERLERLNDGAILPNLRAHKWLYIQVPFLLIAGFSALIRIIRHENIDTIHAHWVIPQGFLAVLYKKVFQKNLKIIATSHGGDIFGLRGRFGTAIKKYTLEHIDHLTVVSTAIRDECLKLGISEEKISIIPMGVDTELFHPSKYDESIKVKYGIEGKLLLFVGRLAEKKGVQYLIDAMPGVIKKYPDTKLLIIGNGPLEEKLKNQVKSLSLTRSIIFIGAIPNSELPRYYATADIFIGPSIEASDGDSEGFGLVFVEAILSGCIVIGSKLHGIKDIINEGGNGFLIEAKNQISITIKILEVMNKGINRSKTRDTHTLNNFSWISVSIKYLKLFQGTSKL